MQCVAVLLNKRKVKRRFSIEIVHLEGSSFFFFKVFVDESSLNHIKKKKSHMFSDVSTKVQFSLVRQLVSAIFTSFFFFFLCFSP